MITNLSPEDLHLENMAAEQEAEWDIILNDIIIRSSVSYIVPISGLPEEDVGFINEDSIPF